MLAIWLAALPVHAAEDFGGYTFYLGDPHVHTGLSGDGGSDDLSGTCSGTCGDFYTVFDDARAAGLDWISVNDHVNGNQVEMEADEWTELLSMALAANDDGNFITIPGGEVWVALSIDERLGHKTMMFFGDDATLANLTLDQFQAVSSTDTIVDSCDAIWDWADGLSSTYGDMLLIPHHPAASLPMPTDWSCHDQTYQPAVEIYSGHGQSISADWDYDEMWSGAEESGTVEEALDPDSYALQLGFIAGSDSHDTRPGNVCQSDSEHTNHPFGGGHTLVVLDEGDTFDRAAIYDAIVSRNTIATTGPMVPVVVSYGSGGASLGDLGDDLAVPTGQELDIEVMVGGEWAAYVDIVEIVTPAGTTELTDEGSDTYSLTVSAGDMPEWLYVQVQLDGDSFYGTSCDDGGDDGTEYAWTSPSYVAEGPDDLDGDGVTYLDGDCHDGDATIYFGNTETWYDGVDQDCDGNDDDYDGDAAPYLIDCDDTDPLVSPLLTETWYDGVDQDCDGNDTDRDHDGADWWDDCNEFDASVSPLVSEIWYDGVDQDCDGNDNDQDHDSWALGPDCNDNDGSVNPSATDIPGNGIDENCAGGDAARVRVRRPRP